MIVWAYTLIGPWLALALGWGVAGAEEWPPARYSAKEIRATVVDEETGQPLAGVIVVAQWVLFVSGVGHGGHGPRLHVGEAVADAAGRFHVPAWGPKPNPRYPVSQLTDRDPLLSFFKPGFRPLVLFNERDRNDAVRVSDWDGKTIKLKQFTGTDSDWAREITDFQGRLAWRSNLVDWRLIPRMVLAVESERLALERKRVNLSFGPSGLSSLGTTAEEVRRYLERQK